MSIWSLPTSDDARRAAGDVGVVVPSRVTFELSPMNDLEATVRGQESESRILVNRFADGEIAQTRKGDLVVVTQRVRTDEESYDVEVLTVDTGTGYLAPVGAAVPVEVEQPVESESEPVYDPAEDAASSETTTPVTTPQQTAEAAPPEGEVYAEPVAEPAPAEVYTAPVYYDNYTSNVEAQYGQDVAYDPYYEQQQANLAAAYDGV